MFYSLKGLKVHTFWPYLFGKKTFNTRSLELYCNCLNLQDDPPHPDLYSDENMLNGHLDMSHDASDSEIDDQDQSSSQFVGSTINLQDLVG